MGRRHRHLFDRITDFANLLAAYRLARKAGRDKPGPAAFDCDLEAGRIGPEDVSTSIRAWLAHAAHAHARRVSRQAPSELTFRCRPRSS